MAVLGREPVEIRQIGLVQGLSVGEITDMVLIVLHILVEGRLVQDLEEITAVVAGLAGDVELRPERADFADADGELRIVPFFLGHFHGHALRAGITQFHFRLPAFRKVVLEGDGDAVGGRRSERDPVGLFNEPGGKAGALDGILDRHRQLVGVPFRQERGRTRLDHRRFHDRIGRRGGRGVDGFLGLLRFRFSAGEDKKGGHNRQGEKTQMKLHKYGIDVKLSNIPFIFHKSRIFVQI